MGDLRNLNEDGTLEVIPPENEDDAILGAEDLAHAPEESPWKFEVIPLGQHNFGVDFKPEGYDVQAVWRGRPVYTEKASSKRASARVLKQIEAAILEFEASVPYSPDEFQDVMSWFLAAKIGQEERSPSDWSKVVEALISEDEDDDILDANDLITCSPDNDYFPEEKGHGNPIFLFDETGKVVSKSRNLAGIRRYVAQYAVARVRIKELKDGMVHADGGIKVIFQNGWYWATRYSDYGVLLNSLRNWRNLYGVPLVVNGEPAGVVGYKNPALIESLNEDEDDDILDANDLVAGREDTMVDASIREWLEANTESYNNAAYNQPEEIAYKFSEWSEYTGTTIDVANARWYAKNFNFVQLWTDRDGKEGFAEIFDSSIPEIGWEQFEKFKDAFEEVKEVYPIIDENLQSEVESEYQAKIWTMFWRREFRGVLIKEYPYLEDMIDAMFGTDVFDSMAHEAEQDVDDVWREENGCDFTYHADRVMKKVTVEMLLDFADKDPVRQQAEFQAFTKEPFTEAMCEVFTMDVDKIKAVMETPRGFEMFKEAVRLYNAGASEYGHIVEEMTPEFLAKWLTPPKVEDPRQMKMELGETEGSHDFSCVMAPASDEVSGALISWGRTRVDDEDVYEGEGDDVKGRENEPHVTVLYGLHETTPSPELLKIIEETQPFDIAVGAASLFESEEYDVLKFDVESEALVNFNARLKGLAFTETHPGYHPHLTVAYVKKGTCKDLTGLHLMEGDAEGALIFEVSEVMFSGGGDEGMKTALFLGKPNVL